jgi:hypothetical protein
VRSHRSPARIRLSGRQAGCGWAARGEEGIRLQGYKVLLQQDRHSRSKIRKTDKGGEFAAALL